MNSYKTFFLVCKLVWMDTRFRALYEFLCNITQRSQPWMYFSIYSHGNFLLWRGPWLLYYIWRNILKDYVAHRFGNEHAGNLLTNRHHLTSDTQPGIDPEVVLKRAVRDWSMGPCIEAWIVHDYALLGFKVVFGRRKHARDSCSRQICEFGKPNGGNQNVACLSSLRKP